MYIYILKITIYFSSSVPKISRPRKEIKKHSLMEIVVNLIKISHKLIFFFHFGSFNFL